MYGIDYYFQEAEKKGEEKANKKARKEKLEIIKNLIKIGLSNRQISEATNFAISEDEVEDLRKNPK
jgi:predicted transposase/invertase (TIGR01784 family)